jgi:hypothetical protein
MFVHDLIRARLLDMPESSKIPPLDSLKKSEWSPEFEQLMRNRLIMGAFRYGLLKAPGKTQWNRINAIIQRAEKYAQTKNKEFLVDIANFCLLEFEEGDGHFNSTEDVEHVKEVK